jgi:hypothetical protein
MRDAQERRRHTLEKHRGLAWTQIGRILGYSRAASEPWGGWLKLNKFFLKQKFVLDCAGLEMRRWTKNRANSDEAARSFLE